MVVGEYLKFEFSRCIFCIVVINHTVLFIHHLFIMYIICSIDE